MNYALAKKLKDAGFPQKGYVYVDIGNNVIRESKEYNTSGQLNAYLPNLSELIEACGDEFWRLEFYQKNQVIYPIGTREEDKDMPKHLKWSAMDRTGHGCMASTPEEAVANLWLALNKKL